MDGWRRFRRVGVGVGVTPKTNQKRTGDAEVGVGGRGPVALHVGEPGRGVAGGHPERLLELLGEMARLEVLQADLELLALLFICGGGG